MPDVTGGTPPTNASPFDVPGDITDVYDHFGDSSMFSVANVAALPASGNWDGRKLFVVSNKLLYQHDGSGWVVIGGDTPYGLMRRTTTALSTPNGSYGDISATAAWSGEVAGGVTYSNGFTVPIAGVYVVSWSALISAGGSGIIGVVANGGVPNGALLHAPGVLSSGGAVFGSASASVRLSAGNTLKLWGYGNGSACTLSPVADQPATQWSIRWVRA